MRRSVGVAGLIVLAGTLLVTVGVAAQQDLPELSISPKSVVVSEDTARGKVTFIARLNRTTNEDVTFRYELAGDSGAEHQARSGEDFAYAGGNPARVTIAAGQRSATIDVQIIDDALDEPDEGFVLLPNSLTNAELSDGIAHYDENDVLLGHWVAGTIQDDDEPPAPVTVSTPSAAESAGRLTFEVGLTGQGSDTVTLTYETVDGTATAPGDYSSASGTLTFAPGDPPKPVTIQLERDGLDESDENFDLVVKSADGSVELGRGTGTILDGDGAPRLRVNDVLARENSRSARFTVTLEPVSSATVTVDYETVDGTATAGDDYIATSGTLTFAPSDSTRTVDVVLVSDSVAEEDETFTLVLSKPRPSTVELDDGTGQATITERSIGPRRGGPIGGDGDGERVIIQPALAPRIGGFLEDVVLVLDQPPTEVDLASRLVGTIDSYRALVADPRIVTAVVSGSGLALIPVAPGVTTVSVSATNSRGSVFQSFRVTVIERVTVIGGAAPQILAFLRDRVLTVGDPPTVLDLAPIFGGAVNSYLTIAGDPQLVEVFINGSNLSLTGLAPGVTTLSVAATGHGGVSLQTFRATVRATPAPGAPPPGPRQEFPTH